MATPDTAFVKQYKDEITLLAQQADFRLNNTIMIDNNFVGEQKFYEQYASDDMVEITSRYADTPMQLPDHRRRMVSARYFVTNTLEDPVDALQMLIDPKSTYMQAKQAAAARKKDDLVIAALGGNAWTGKTGAVAQALTLTIVEGATGMTKIKCINAKRLLDAGEVEEFDRTMVVGSQQLADLLNTTEVTSSDYNIVRTLVQGEINTWLGFTWKRSERLLVDGSAARLVYAFQKKGMQLAMQKDVEGRISERPDKNYAWQVYLRIAGGATRLEEARVVQIACHE